MVHECQLEKGSDLHVVESKEPLVGEDNVLCEATRYVLPDL